MPRSWRPAALDLALCAALKAAASALVLLSGFRAISDDDYARVVIAERFADAPALDPSGTSWLPFPFYGYGAALRLFGASLDVARAVACASGVLGVSLVLYAARLLKLTRGYAVMAALLGGLLPYSLYLGAATIPEAITSALMLFAAATLVREDALRFCGAAALFIATGSRYEAWPLALVFAAISAHDAYKLRANARTLALSAALALAFPAAWLLHGVVRHGDALFFVARVSAYRAALGPDATLAARLLRTPFALFSAEPEIMLAGVAALSWLLLTARSERRLWLRALLPLAAVFAFLVLGDARGAAPTHHGERALLSLWLAAGLLVARALEGLSSASRHARALAAVVAAAALAFGFVVRGHAPRAPFVDRALAEDVGWRARRAAPRLAIDAPDFSFFAVQAAFGAPQRTLVLDDRDPRRPRPLDLLALDAEALRERLLKTHTSWLALPRSRAPLAHDLGRISEGNSEWVLLQLQPR